MRGKKNMIYIGVLIIFIGIIIVFFNINYSKTRSEFNNLTRNLKAEVNSSNEVITEEDIKNLPKPVQKYFRYCGFIGIEKMDYMKATFKNVSFSLGKDKPNCKIDYTQYNFIDNVNRIAFIDTTIMGVPFQGLDSFVEGKGSMKGVICKLFTLFNQRGESMDRASLVTYLGECLWIPSAALQDNINWEEIDDLHVKATLSCYGIEVSGIFEFNHKGEMTSFYTTDRELVAMDGTIEKVPWTAICANYEKNEGLMQPTKLQATWNYKDGDYLYFDSDNLNIEFNK